jgi:hypothetical protein
MSTESITLLELKRQLNESNLDKRTQYFFAELYEHQIAMAQDLDKAMSVLLSLAETVEKFVALHEATQGQVNELRSRGKIDGVDVRSMPIMDDPTKN